MGEEETAQPSGSIFDKVDRTVLRPVDSRLLDPTSTSPEAVSLVVDNSLSFAATDLLALTPDDVDLLSKRVRLLFTKVASQNRVKIDKKGLDQFKNSDVNPLSHEIDHLRRIVDLRPELIEDASVNILAVLHDGQLAPVMNVMVPTPDVEYTALEKTFIQVAPNLPSDPDYFNLIQYIKERSCSRDDIEKIREIVSQKRQSSGREHFLADLSQL